MVYVTGNDSRGRQVCQLGIRVPLHMWMVYCGSRRIAPSVLGWMSSNGFMGWSPSDNTKMGRFRFAL